MSEDSARDSEQAGSSLARAELERRLRETQSEMEKLVLEHKKREMIERYASQDAAEDLLSQYQSKEMQEGKEETKELLAQEPRA